jgi:hypothetical protein
MRTFLATVLLLFATTAAPADPPEVKKIWDQAPHNAFTDLIRFHDRWICSFREGAGHAAGAGKMRVLTSADGDHWESAALIEQEGADLRDPKLSATPDGRLMLLGGAAVPPTRDPVTDHYSFVCFSKDGKEWDKPRKVLGSWQWLWRVTWHNGTAYGVAYQWDPRGKPVQYTALLYKSPDGLKWEKVASFDFPGATEAALAFNGDTLFCLQRRDGKPNSAMLGTSQPPYAEWVWKDLGASFGGPNMLRLPDGSWVAAGRLMQDGKPKTVVCRLDVKDGKLTPLQVLPSGGDTSYPGLAWHDGKLWVSYYSSHEGKAGIYLAKMRID